MKERPHPRNEFVERIPAELSDWSLAIDGSLAARGVRYVVQQQGPEILYILKKRDKTVIGQLQVEYRKKNSFSQPRPNELILNYYLGGIKTQRPVLFEDNVQNTDNFINDCLAFTKGVDDNEGEPMSSKAAKV